MISVLVVSWVLSTPSELLAICYNTGDLWSPFFMSYKQRIFSSLTNPVLHIVLIIGGLLLFVGHVHNETHRTIELDVDSYVKKFCNKNKSTCRSYANED